MKLVFQILFVFGFAVLSKSFAKTTHSAVAAKSGAISKAEEVEFKSGELTLRGLLYKPQGEGPFPAVLYNHGSAPGLVNNQAAEILGPLFVKHGWVHFMPYRRGQGLSEKAGPYIMDEVKKVYQKSGKAKAAEKMLGLLKTDHLNDEMAAYDWLKNQKFVSKKQIAVAGNSFGGILTVLGAEKIQFCAAINASGAAQSWAESPQLQEALKESVRNSQSPMFFFQAQNDFDLSPSQVLSEELKRTGKTAEVKIYPAFGKSPQDGHSFAYKGSSVWAEDVFGFLKSHCGK